MSKIVPNIMQNNKTYFKHTEHQIAVDNLAISRLFVLLQNDHLIPENRAVLHKSSAGQDNNYGFKSALWITLEDTLSSSPVFSDFKGLWLIEHHNHKVQLLGSQKYCTSKSIGGRVIHDTDILSINAYWISDLAHHLASTLEQKIEHTFMDYSRIATCQIPDSMIFHDIELDLLINAIQAFINELNEETINVLQKEGTGNNIIYNHYVSDNPEQKRNRIQAADNYPWFGSLLRSDYKLRQAVDAGKALSTELATRYQVKPRTIKLFQNFIQPDFLAEGSYSGNSRVVWMKSVDHYTAEYFPKTNEDHTAFFSISEPLLTLAELLQVEPVKLAKPFRNGWKSGIEQLERQLDHPLDFEAIFNMIQACFYYGVKSLLERTKLYDISHPPSNWYKVWFAQYGLKRLFKMANQWEQVYGQFSCIRLGIKTQSNTKENLASLRWPSLLSSNYCRGPYRMVELTSQPDLENEGRKLEHCVGSYGLKCLIHGSYIYSIRDRSGNSLSTFEIKFKNDKAELLQHYAMDDSEPTNEQQACVRYFVERALSSVSQEKRAMIEAKRHEIWGVVQGKLCKPDTQVELLTHTEKKELQEMIAFTHPTDMQTNNFYQFFNEKVLGIETCATQQKCITQIQDILI